MPFYEYQCSHCQHHLEAMQKLSDKALRKCPSCGRSALKKLMSAPVFRLKGSGWYETDFKSDQDAKRNLAVEKDETPVKADAKADVKADVKPDTKADNKDSSEKKTESAKPEPAKPASAKPVSRKPKAKSAPRRKARR